MPHETLCIAMAQLSIVWERPTANLDKIYAVALEASSKGVELLVFPEVMTTGFSMDLTKVAEPIPSPSLARIQSIVEETGVAIVSSILVRDGEHCYNRIFMLTPDAGAYFQDKRHLFRMGGEAEVVTPASSRQIISYRGWNILLVACYDLRFPVWCRNRANEYDVLIDVANWPEPRRSVWSTLLQARAMENLSYVCGVNRVGEDNVGAVYAGDSAVIDPRGNKIAVCPEKEESISVVTLERSPMEKLRKKFPVWLDADPFVLDVQALYPQQFTE